MNFFNKNRLVFWLLLFLVVINISALVTFILFYSGQKKQQSENTGARSFQVFQKELSLTPIQSGKVCSINAQYRTVSEPISSALKAKRSELLEELSMEKPDTLLLKKYAEEIGNLQKELQIVSIRQYLDLKEVCDSCQCQKLSSFYFQLYGSKGPGPGMGKQMQHRYRHGQKQQECNKMKNQENVNK
jgi:Spy/CpxP family protein refolding chaperone